MSAALQSALWHSDSTGIPVRKIIRWVGVLESGLKTRAPSPHLPWRTWRLGGSPFTTILRVFAPSRFSFLPSHPVYEPTANAAFRKGAVREVFDTATFSQSKCIILRFHCVISCCCDILSHIVCSIQYQTLSPSSPPHSQLQPGPYSSPLLRACSPSQPKVLRRLR